MDELDQLKQYRREAKDTFGSVDIEIEEYAAVRLADDGAWVEAWVWVPKAEDEEDEEQ